MRIAAVLTMAILAGAAHAQSAPATEPFISIAGAAHVHVAPDYAEFSADVVTRVEGLEAATQKHTPRAEKAVAVLRTMAKHGVSIERSTFLKDEERVLDDARRAAVRNARRQAEVYAGAAGVALGEILEMTEGAAGGLGSEAALRMPAPNVQLTPPATIPFRAAITIKRRIRPKP
jgi:uncharacterized protein YggE